MPSASTVNYAGANCVSGVYAGDGASIIHHGVTWPSREGSLSTLPGHSIFPCSELCSTCAAAVGPLGKLGESEGAGELFVSCKKIFALKSSLRKKSYGSGLHYQ